MFVLLASASFAAPLPLPMPSAPLCAAGDRPFLHVGATFYEGDADWMTQVECDDEADCLATLSRLQDPRVTYAADQADPSMDPTLLPAGVEAELRCETDPARLHWTCDAAGCGLSSTRLAPGQRWTSLEFDTLPGRPDRTVTDLVALDERTLRSRGSTQLADLVKGTARRMDAALDRCEAGVPCPAGWAEARALTAPFLTDGRATFVDLERGMWGEMGFEARFTAASAPSAEATLSCYLVEGGCGLSAATCALAFGPADAPVATFTAADDTTRWGDASYGIHRWGDESPVLVTRLEGWKAAATPAVEATAAR